MLRRFHRAAAYLAFTIILCLFLSSIFVEVFGRVEHITLVKTVIIYPIPFLIISMIGAGMSGTVLGKTYHHSSVRKKAKRMPFIAVNGMIILLPLAYVLYTMSINEHFDFIFYTIQAAELVFGGLNIYLMALNIIDAKKLRRSCLANGINN